MNPLTLDELRDLAPGFVMGTLTPDESAQFDAAMRDAATAELLAPEIDAHRAALEFLATEHAVTPPPALRDRVMARIASEPNVSNETRDAQSTARTNASNVASAVTGESAMGMAAGPRLVRTPGATRAVRVAPQPPPPVSVSRTPWIVSAISIMALAASVVFSVDLTNQVNSLRGEVSQKDELLKRSLSRLADRDATVGTLTEAGAKLVLVQLAPTSPEGPGIQLFWNVKNGTAVVHASGLAQVAANRTYCLWMIRDGKPVAIKLFKPDPDGHRLINGVELPKDMQGIAAFAVTEEPAEGSPQPTMTPFLVGAVTAPAAPK